MKDLVSVIIPVYNREKYIKECIESILSQTYQNFEIIVIDDGSTDNTLEICREISNADKRIKLFTEKHGGVSNARNVGLDAAEGEFVFFLDSDDIIHHNLLEDLIDGIKQYDTAIAFTERFRVSDEKWHKAKQRIANDNSEVIFKCFDSQEIFRDFIIGGTKLNLVVGVMMKRSFIGETKFKTDLFIGEDYFFNYEILLKGANAVQIEPKRYFLRLHENNSSWNYTLSGFLNRYYRRELVWVNEEKCGRPHNADLQKRAVLSSMLFCIENNSLSSDDSRKIRKYVKIRKNILYPAFDSKSKILYFLGVYFPIIYIYLYKAVRWIKKCIFKIRRLFKG